MEDPDMPSSEKIAIAAHLHVLLRRKTGRVTDTEWMATNAEYAAEIVRFSREKAVEDGHIDLGVWADRLEEIMASPEARHRVPLVRMMADAVKERTGAAPATAAPVPDQQGARSVNTEEEVYPESGFIESTFGNFFGDSEKHRERKPRDPDAPRYVKGLR
jgi:hypothetical protein